MRIFLLIFLVSIFSCNSGLDKEKQEPHDLKKYYFPYAKMFDTLVYHYQTQSPSPQDIYWIMFTTTKNKDTLFHSYNFSENDNIFLTIENMQEKIASEGSTLTQFQTIYISPLSGTNYENAEIKSGQIYDWKLFPDDSLYFELVSPSLTQFQARETTSKTRKFSKFEDILHFPMNGEGKPLNTVSFTEKFKIVTTSGDKSVQDSVQFTRTTWYAENIGFVKFIQQYGSTDLVGELKEIIPFQKWDRKKQFRAIMNEVTFVPFSGVQ